MTDWATISSIATAGGTLVLAVATYSAVLQGWHVSVGRARGEDPHHPAPEEFTRQQRDLYIPASDTGHEGGQLTISLFGVRPAGDDAWVAEIARHWTLAAPDPRLRPE